MKLSVRNVPRVRLPDPTFSVFERAIAAVGLYGAAVRRYEKRQAFEEARAYIEAAKIDRLKGSWSRLAADSKALTLSDRKVVAERADWLVFSDSTARHVVDVIADNTIGTGIKTQSKIEFSRNAQINERMNTRIEDAKARWMDEADALGRMHWYEMQTLWLQRLATVGEILRYRVYLDDPSRFLPLAYELIETSRLTDFGTSGVAPGAEVLQGVEIDKASGRVLAYHVLEDSYTAKTRRLPASDCDLSFRVDRPGQIRGISWFAPVMSQLFTYRELLDYTMVARKVQSALAVIVGDAPKGKGDPPSLPGLKHPADADTTTTSGDSKRVISPGMIHHVHGGSIHTLQPSQNHDLEMMLKALLRGIGVGFGFSYEWLSGDYEQTSYAGGRLSNQEARRRIRPIHTFVVNHSEKPVHRDFIDAGTAFGRLPAIPATRDPYVCRFSKPHWEWGVNPQQEVRAAIEAVESGLSTYREEIESRGGDWQEFLKQVSTEIDFGDDLGLTLYSKLRGVGLESGNAARAASKVLRLRGSGKKERAIVAIELDALGVQTSGTSLSGEPSALARDFVDDVSDVFDVEIRCPASLNVRAVRDWLDAVGLPSERISSGGEDRGVPFFAIRAGDESDLAEALSRLFDLPANGKYAGNVVAVIAGAEA